MKNRAAAIARVEQLILHPQERTLEEKAPVIRMKDGRRVMVERVGGLGYRGLGYRVSQDFGCTCKAFAYAFDLEGILDALLSLTEVK